LFGLGVLLRGFQVFVQQFDALSSLLRQSAPEIEAATPTAATTTAATRRINKVHRRWRSQFHLLRRPAVQVDKRTLARNQTALWTSEHRRDAIAARYRNQFAVGIHSSQRLHVWVEVAQLSCVNRAICARANLLQANLGIRVNHSRI